jgi:aspartate/methionine/tyrosine aminotransferase
MMGWRLGWVVGSKDIIDNMVKVHTNLTLNLGSFHQSAAATILNDRSIDQYFETHVREIAGNVTTLKRALAKTDLFELYVNTPGGALFLFPRITKLFNSLPRRYKELGSPGECVFEYLLEEAKIAVVPGMVYGSRGRDYIRIVAAVDKETIDKAATRFSNLSIEVSQPL